MKSLKSVSEWDTLSNGKDSLIIDFSATWCGPCREMHRLLAQIEKEFPKLKIVEVDVDRFGEIASEMRIQAVPTLFFFKNGKKIGKTVGLIGIDALRRYAKKIA